MTQTSEQIIDSAKILLQKYGFNAFSYQDISKEIGIKKASIHYHFPSKQALGKTVMASHRKLHNASLNKIDTEIKNPLDKLHAFAELFSTTLGKEFLMCPCGMLTSDINTLPESIKNEVQGFYTDSEVWLANVLREGQKQGVVTSNVSAVECARTLFAAFEGAMFSAITFEDKNRLTKSTRHFINLIKTA